MNITITLSYFHRKVGPLIYYNYPEQNLQDNEKVTIADIMDQANDEGSFSYSLENLFTMNYYFEIFSSKARGKKEMLMVSVIFIEKMPQNVEIEIINKCKKFAYNLKKTNDVFWAFYKEDDPQISENEIVNIKKNNELIEKLVKDLYFTTIEIAREKSEEEKIASLMNQKSVYETLKFLSDGPIAHEDLEKWFNGKFPEISLQEILTKLENERFIFINDIGVEVYVLLVKDVRVERIPPDWGITLFDQPEISEITDFLYSNVKKFFNNYKRSIEDEMILLNLVANSSIYNILSNLRKGPMENSKVANIESQERQIYFQKNLTRLKTDELIDYFEYNGNSFILLQTDIRFTISFPNYLKKLIPKDIKSHVAKSYDPTIINGSKSKNSNAEEIFDIGLKKLGEKELKELAEKTNFTKK